jgi:uncharacterized oxidoreductase
MPVFSQGDVFAIGTAILRAVGASDEEARLVVEHHIEAILSGEGDHGFRLGTQYIPDILAGVIKPGAPISILSETPTTLTVDGNFNFGHAVSHEVMIRLIAKAETQFVAAASIRYQCHVGRLMDYTRMAADNGMIALMMCDGAWGPKMMAPVGGLDRRIGINPWSMALPNDTGGVVGFDMTATVTSGSKIIRAFERGEDVPEGWILDSEGRPTTDPGAFFRGGSFLPTGGIAAHKGYALAFMIEVLADILSGMGFKEDNTRPWPVINGCFMAVFNVEAFRPLVDFKRDLSAFIDWVKSSRIADGSQGVFYPGERSKLNAERNRDIGLDIPRFIWEQVLRHAQQHGVDPALVPAALRPGAFDHLEATSTMTPRERMQSIRKPSGS